jgi:hypothetical protein
VRPLKLLLVHPGPLMYSELFSRLEPLGLERVAGAAAVDARSAAALPGSAHRQDREPGTPVDTSPEHEGGEEQ